MIRISDIAHALLGKYNSTHEKIKVLCLSIAFFLVIGAYTIVKELKDAVFLGVVGRENLPYAKFASMIVLIPLVLIYSRLVDILRRSSLLYVYCLLYAVLGFIFAYYLVHPTIGLLNTDTDRYRIFGWLFYFFIEGYSPFVVSLLWAFVNSISAPDAIKNQYVVMTAASKLGGIVIALFASWLLMRDETYSALSDAYACQGVLIVASAALILVPLVVYVMKRLVPSDYFHGYEAAYKHDKKVYKEHKDERGIKAALSGALSGVVALVRYPYVMGIFGMLFFWELVNVTLSYTRLGVCEDACQGTGGLLVMLYEQAIITHIIGFVVVLIGTRTVITLLGERKSLMLVPILMGVSIAIYLFFQSVAAVSFAYIMMRAVNYAIASPLRESLYIPTSRQTKFKAKSLIDGFGSKFSKATGSVYNLIIEHVAVGIRTQFSALFFGVVVFLWTLTASGLGKRFEDAVSRNEVIGG